MLEACIRRGVQNLVYISSNCAVTVGQAGITAESEKDVLDIFAKTTPHCAYGRSKKEATQLVVAANGSGRLRTLVLLPGFIIGPGEPKFMVNIMKEEIMPFSRERTGKLNFVCRTSVGRAIMCSLVALHKPDVSRTAGHIFMISDVLENFADFETAVRKALGRPHDKHVNALMPLVCTISQLFNWMTNDRYNFMFLQGTFAAMELSQRAPELRSTHEAQTILGWTPTSRETIIQDLVNYYKPATSK